MAIIGGIYLPGLGWAGFLLLERGVFGFGSRGFLLGPRVLFLGVSVGVPGSGVLGADPSLLGGCTQIIYKLNIGYQINRFCANFH